MDEKDFTTQSQDSESVEVSVWANRAIRCVVFGFAAPVAFVIIITSLRFLPFESRSYNDLLLALVMLSIAIGIPAIGILMLVGLIFGIMALRDI